eukprot:scaffold2556_cov425-Prasinococcus_capsulatus_cf.AAC.8
MAAGMLRECRSTRGPPRVDLQPVNRARQHLPARGAMPCYAMLRYAMLCYATTSALRMLQRPLPRRHSGRCGSSPRRRRPRRLPVPALLDSDGPFRFEAAEDPGGRGT